MTFADAIEFLRRQSVMPTALRSWALQRLPVEIRERSFFSAGVTQAVFLQEALDSVKDIVAGSADRATMRLQLRSLLDRTGYRPLEGEEGTLTDLRSDRRLNLILDTNAEQARAYGRHRITQAPEILDAYPCSELVRVGGMPARPRDWPGKWQAAGGTLYAGRMIARKDDPIWSVSIEQGGFNRFGTRYGPFDFNSGMRERDVPRDEAITLGVIRPDDRITPDEESFNEQISASARRIASPELLRAIRESGVATIDPEGRFVPS